MHKVTFKDAKGKRRKGTVTVTDKALLFQYKSMLGAKQLVVMRSSIGAVSERLATLTLHLSSGKTIKITALPAVFAALQQELAA